MAPEPGQLDIVVSIGDAGRSLFVCQEPFSKVCARVLFGGMVLAWEDTAGCHSETCEANGSVGAVAVMLVVVVEFDDDAWDFDARCLPVL